jgi:hypothetical protein
VSEHSPRQDHELDDETGNPSPLIDEEIAFDGSIVGEQRTGNAFDLLTISININQSLQKS